MSRRRQQSRRGTAPPAVALAVGWTGFVWIGRIRNALADDDLEGAALAGVLVLSTTFLVFAGAALVMLVRELRGTPPGRAGQVLVLANLVLANLVLAAAVWSVRIVDIALLSDHDPGFIVVHVLLGVVSVGLWWWALVAVRRSGADTEAGSEEIASSG